MQNLKTTKKGIQSMWSVLKYPPFHQCDIPTARVSLKSSLVLIDICNICKSPRKLYYFSFINLNHFSCFISNHGSNDNKFRVNWSLSVSLCVTFLKSKSGGSLINEKLSDKKKNATACCPPRCLVMFIKLITSINSNEQRVQFPMGFQYLETCVKSKRKFHEQNV